VAGNGTAGFDGDNGPATSASLNYPTGITVDKNDNLFIADFYNHRIRRIAADTGVITTMAGNGSIGFNGDSSTATSASLNYPIGITFDKNDNLYIADYYNHRIRKVAAATGIITTVAGNGTAGFDGDNIAATSTRLYYPHDVTVDSSGNIFIPDQFNNRVRKVTAATGIITTVAGNGTAGFNGDNGAATSSNLYNPVSVAIDSNGNLYIADYDNNRIRKVAAATGIITTVAGGGSGGDNGAATLASLNRPLRVTVDSNGNLYISDFYNYRVRMVYGIAAAAISAPTATTGPTSEVSATGGILSGTVSSNGALTTVTFQYGTTISYGSTAAAGQSPLASDAAGSAVTASVSGLTCGTRYHYRITATNSAGTTDGDDATFTTTACPPPVNGACGSPSTFPATVAVPSVGTGYNYSAALKSDGSVISWGLNWGGPGAVMQNTVRLSVGWIHSMALKSDGTLWARGLNSAGQLGLGNTDDNWVFTQVPGITDVVSVAAGSYHTVALRSDGTVWTWGWNNTGQLGYETPLGRSLTPVQVPNLSGVVSVSAGTYSSFAIKGDGTVAAWGSNGSSQLGDGTSINRATPVDVQNISGVKSIANNNGATVALLSDGTVKAWGSNTHGELGDDTGIDSSVPVLVKNLTGVTAISGTWLHTLAIKTDGTVWGWGYNPSNNSNSMLGDGTLTDRFSPVQIPGLSGIVSIAAGGAQGMALKNDGSIAAWGDNSYGQLGDGSIIGRSIPVDVIGINLGPSSQALQHYSANLCSTGIPSLISGSGPWSWTCSGYDGGTHASCTASDETPPQFTTFTVPASTNTFQVSVTMDATDNVGVTGWCLNESGSAAACVWSADKLVSFTLAGQGTRTLHAFARDAAGNIASTSALVEVAVPYHTLTVTIAGTGSGTVTSDPAGISCTTATCSHAFPNETSVSLLNTEDNQSVFGGWGGDCNGNGSCSVTMSADKTVTATFTAAPRARVGAKEFSNLQAAYNDPATISGSVIKLLNGPQTGSFSTGTKGITVTIEGGYDAPYITNTSETTIQAPVTLQSGTVTMNGIIVK